MDISGYAALFNVETVIAGLFRERIAPGAFAEGLKRDDVRALFNHNPDVVLGRKIAGTLSLREDANGLVYRVLLNEHDPAAASVAAKIERGDVSGSSFWFAVVAPDDEEWTPPDARGGLPLRTLKKLRLIDVSAVTFPAYEPTTVSLRNERSAIAIRERTRLQIQIARAKGRC
jgi:HK97 family phage prohead protease